MVKNNQKIYLLLPTIFLSVFNHFVVLAPKGLIVESYSEPCQTSKMELFLRIFLATFSCSLFSQISQMIKKVLNTLVSRYK